MQQLSCMMVTEDNWEVAFDGIYANLQPNENYNWLTIYHTMNAIKCLIARQGKMFPLKKAVEIIIRANKCECLPSEVVTLKHYTEQ